MKDHEYILNKTTKLIKDNLEVVEGKLIGGGSHSMEDYRYNCGLIPIVINNSINGSNFYG
jgi:hypothetical protein